MDDHHAFAEMAAPVSIAVADHHELVVQRVGPAAGRAVTQPVPGVG